jgi:gluconokinase
LDPATLKALYQTTGAPIHTAYALPQLRVWYQSSGNTERVHGWQTIASVCIARWTGSTDIPISFSEASWTGLLNFRSCEYESTILQLLPPVCIAALPRLADYTGQSRSRENNDSFATSSFYLSSSLLSPKDPTGTTNPYWLRWPRLQAARLFLGVGDGACANLGSGCGTNTGRIACTIGTSAAARVCVPCPIWSEPKAAMDDAPLLRLESGLFCYRIDAARVLIGGALTDGGSALEWVTNLLRLPMTSDDFQACLEAATERLQESYRRHEMEEQDASCKSPLVLPFWSGERSTGYRTGATGAILGLTLNTGAEDLVLSTLEGVTLRLSAIVRLIRRVMEDSPFPPVMVLCSGKALERNVLWRTMLADCTGLPVAMEDQTYEATSRGVAMLLRDVLVEQGLPLWNNSKGPMVLDRSSQNTHVPNESARGYWDTRFQTQEAILEAIAPILYHNKAG